MLNSVISLTLCSQPASASVISSASARASSTLSPCPLANCTATRGSTAWPALHLVMVEALMLAFSAASAADIPRVTRWT